MNPKVTLVSWTNNPIETIYIIWQASKSEKKLLSVSEVDKTKSQELFTKIVAQNIPVSEHINFVFMLENVSVSFREQMVRHRIGTHVGDRLGVDIVPGLADSSWWSQSMRIQNMGKFFSKEQYRIPDSIKENSDAKTIYNRAMSNIQESYTRLLDKGIPMEDARDLIPLGTHHRISWVLNLSSLQHIIGKRCCWILQSGLWFPIIKGMIDELCQKVDPIFRDLANPPCIKNDKFNTCVYNLENERRIEKKDLHHCCPLWLNETGNSQNYQYMHSKRFLKRKQEYKTFWNRNTKTGDKL